MSALPRVRAGLLRHPLDNQVLVYDPRDEKVHLLDPTTACVLDLIEEGRWSLDKMTSELSRRNKVAADPALVSLALDELRRVGLLDESSVVPAPLVDVSRREIVRKLAMTGAAALLVPAVATLTATRGYAQSLIGVQGAPCSTSTQCGPGLVCCGTVCSSTCGVPVGGACPNGNSQCTSGICCNGICASQACSSAADCNNCQTDGECVGGACSSFHSCGTGNDQGKAKNGATCTGNGSCCSNHCRSNVCTAT